MSTITNSQRLAEIKKKKEKTSANQYSNSERLEILKFSSSLEKLNTDYNDLYTSYNSRFFDKDGNFTDSYGKTDNDSEYENYSQKAARLNNEIGEIQNHLKKYGNLYDSESLKSINAMLENASGGIKNMGQAYEFYSNFHTENDYNAYIMNNTADLDGGMSAEGIAARIKAHEKVTARLEAIDNEIADMSDEEKWVNVLNPYNGSQMATSTIKEPSEKYQKLLDEKEYLEEQTTAYERYAKNSDRYAQKVKDDKLYAQFDYEEYLKNPERYLHDITGIPQGMMNGRTEYLSVADTSNAETFKSGVNDPLTQYLAFKEGTQTPENFSDSKDLHDDIMQKGADGRWEYLNEEEKKYYYYLIAENDYVEALDFLEGMRNVLYRREEIAKTEAAQKLSGWALAADNIASVPQNIAGGVMAFFDDADAWLRGDEIDPYSLGHQLQSDAQITRGETARRIDTVTGGGEFLGVSWGDAYQAAMSGIDSVVGVATFGKGYTVIMGMGAASSKAKQLYEHGASNTQIATASLLSGVAEMAFEKFSIDHFLGEFVNAPTKKWYKLLGQTALQGGIEMTEEMATELSNIFTDVMVLGSRSEWEKLITSYKEQGYSDWEAISSAMWDKGGDILEDGIMGFISGGGMGSVGAVINATNTNKAYDKFYKQTGEEIVSADNIKSLVAEAKALDNTKANAKVRTLAAELEGVDASKQNAKEKTAFEKKAGQLYEAVLQAQNKQGKASFDTAKKNIIREHLHEKGVTDETEIEAATQAIMKVVYNKGKLTAKESELLEKVGGNEIASYLINNAAEVTANGIVTSIENKAKINEIASLTKKSNTYVREVNTDGYIYSGDGKTYVDGESTPVDITGIASIKNGRMTVELSDGRTAELGDIILGRETQAILYEGALDMGVDAASAQAIVNSYDENAELGALEYVYGMRQAIEYGKIGAKAFLDTGAFTAALNSKQRELGYEVGRMTAENESKREAERKQRTMAKNEKDGLPRREAPRNDRVSGGIRFDGITEKDLNETQRTTVNVFKQLFGGYGVTIEFFKSAVNEYGTHTGENGSYDPDTNTLRLDINAGAQGKDTILFTAAHELTHFIKQWSPEKFRVFGEFLLNSYAKHGVSIDDLIKEQQAKAERNGRELDYEAAYEEVVADSCETFLRDSRLFDKLLNLKEKDLSLFDKTKKYISDLFDKVSGLRHKYKSFNPDSKEGKVVTQMTDAIEQLHRLWEDAAMTALENSRRASGTAQQKNTAEKGGEVVRLSQRDNSDNSIKEQLKANLNILNSMKTVASVQEFKTFEYKQQTLDWVLKRLENTGYKVNRKGFGEIVIDDKRIKSGLRYSKTNEEKLGFAVLPQVLAKGVEIDTHTKHKNRAYDTITFAAPVVINGQRGNMAVVVRQEGKNYYKVHRLVMPDGSQFILNKKRDTAERAGGVEINSGLSPADNVSKNSIRNPESNVKQKQLEIIQQTNPMWDDYHTGIRTTDDIHTWVEVLQLNDEHEGQFVWGDFSRADAEKALKDGNITVYSSYPIKNGVFVSTSYIQAKEYAGGRNGKVYSKTIPLTDVAWINGDEGQYAKVGEAQKNTTEKGGVKYSDRDIKNDFSYENLNSSDYYTNDKIYSYKFLTAQKDMTVVNVPNIDNIFTNKKIDRARIVATGKENAKNTNDSIVDEKDSVFVTNVYTKKRYRIDNQSIKHGLGGDKNYLITNSRLGMVIGDIVKNAIPINALKNKTSDVEGTFAMVSYGVSEAQKEFISIVTIEIRTGDVKSVETIESVHSVSGRIKKGSHVGNKPQGDRHMSNPFTTSTISISQLLEIVNSSHQSILSDDVLNHFGKTRNLNGTYSNDVLFSDRDPAFVSDRELLADALMSVVKNDGEFQILTDYKNNVKQMYMQQQKLDRINMEIKELKQTEPNWYTDSLKKLYEEATKTKNRISNYDKKLLKLEAATPLREVLKREKQAAKKKQREIDVEKLKNEKANLESKNREKLANYRESLKKSEMRRKIRHVISDLNGYYAHGNKKKNVKIDLQGTVAATLASAEILFSTNITSDDAVRNANLIKNIEGAQNVITRLSDGESELLDEYGRLLEKREQYTDKIDSMLSGKGSAKAIDELWDMVERIDGRITVLKRKLSDWLKRERARLNEEGVNTAIETLANAYKAIKDSEVDYIKGAYDEFMLTRIESLKEQTNGSTIRDMDLVQLTNLYDVYNMVLTTLRKSNRLFVSGKTEYVDVMAGRVTDELNSMKKRDKESSVVLIEKLKNLTWEELKPIYAFERLGSDTLMRLYLELRKGEDTFGADIAQAKTFVADKREAYGFDEWDTKTVKGFKLSSGRTFELTLPQRMSIYAYSKREQAAKHMSEGGFVFDTKEYFVEKNGVFEKVKNTAEPYKLTDEDLEKITGTLTEEQKMYVDDMQEYLSKVMGAKGNEVSRELYGIDLFKELFYFPLKSSEDYLATLNKVTNAVSLRNSGMTKELNPDANNPIVLSGFDLVWAAHVNKMSLYHSFVIGLENFRRVYNYHTDLNESGYSSVKTAIKNIYGEGANSYISKFIDDVNGGMPSNEMDNILAKGFTTFKKTAVAASLSTAMQQPTAVIRAMAEIDTKYFLGGKVTKLSHSETWEEIKKYAPIAVLKEIGGFDAGSGRNISEYLIGYDGSKLKKVMHEIDDKSMWLTEKSDEIGWNAIWNAVKRETKAQNKGLNTESEEFLLKCGERFTEVVTKTQVYDSVFSRNGFMRSKSEFNKAATAFGAEPATAFNMLFSTVLQLKRGKIAVKKAARIVGSVVASQVLANVMAALIYALRDDDENESYFEKYSQTFLDNPFISIVLFVPEMLPYVRDLISVFEGYGVERPDMSIVQDVKDAIYSLGSDTKSAYRKTEDMLGGVANLFGVPLKNVMRTGREIWNLGRNVFDDNVTSFDEIGDVVVEGMFGETSAKDVNKALEKGKTDKAKQHIDELIGEKMQKYIDEGEQEPEKKAKSGVRSSVTSYWKPQYEAAVKAKDYDEMNRIRKLLYSTGLYGTLRELDKDLEDWRREVMKDD